MIQISTKDGQVFTGVTAAEIVRQMKNTEWFAPVRKRDYMLEVIQRVEDMTGVFVNQDELPTASETDEMIDPANFLKYLASVGLIQVTEVE